MIGKSIEYDEHDERILRRLAGALIVLWDGVPEKLQSDLIQQAAVMTDRVSLGSHGHSLIKEFIDAHKGGD